MIKVYLKNSSTLKEQCLTFPEPRGEEYSALEIENGSAIEISAAVSQLEGMNKHLAGMWFDPEKSFRELNFLSWHTEGMTKGERAVFQAALEIEKPHTLAEMVNLSCNLDKFVFFQGICNQEELGQYVLEMEEVSEEIAPYVDKRAVGKRYAKEHMGCFADCGYVKRSGEALQIIYDGGHLPDPGYDRSCILQVYLSAPGRAAGSYRYYPVSLPASEERLAQAVKNLGKEKPEDCEIIYVNCFERELEDYLPFSLDVRELNAFVGSLAEKGLLKQEESRKKLFAALEAEAPGDIAGAAEIAARLECYRTLPEEIRTAEDYAAYCMEKEQTEVADDLRRFFDCGGYGKYRMEKDGVVQTENGLVYREDCPIRQADRELTEFKLFSPLKAYLFPYDEERGVTLDMPEEISPSELCRYRDEILERIRQEQLEGEGERGLAVYLQNRLLSRKVFCMNPTVEVWNGQLWGVLEVKTYGSLSHQEMKGLMSAWVGQESDGWGEGFEQREIKTEDGDICVSFWNPGKDFFMKTEQELKTPPEQSHGITMRGM